MERKNILFICGSMNQTTMMHQIATHLPEHNLLFSPYYSDGLLRHAVNLGLLEWTIMGRKIGNQTEEYLTENNLMCDYGGYCFDYDLVVTCSDLIVPKNIRDKKIVLVQEGMTDPQNVFFYLVKYLGLPAYLASTSTTGLSDAYEVFCVASEGYRQLFIQKGVKSEKIQVTGIPNFDNASEYLANDFPHKNYVMVATSDTRETFKFDNRKKFFNNIKSIAANRQLLFKLHPNENFARASQEIKQAFPDALIYQQGNTNHMIANCDVLITQYSSVVYIGLALEKEVHSYFDLESLQKLTPIQNGGTSAKNIADVCSYLLSDNIERRPSYVSKKSIKFRSELVHA
jgi:hypothetical protein